MKERAPRPRQIRCAECFLPALREQLNAAGVCLSCVFAIIRKNEARTLKDSLTLLRAKGLCAYCGEPSAHVEHVVPRRTNLPTYTVPACAECNLLAGGRLFGSFREKQDYIKTRLRKKYHRILNQPEWDTYELRSMGYNLRKKIQGEQMKREIALARLAWCTEALSSMYDAEDAA